MQRNSWEAVYRRYRRLEAEYAADEEWLLLGVVQGAPEGSRRFRDECAKYDLFRKSPRARGPHPAISEGLLADLRQIASRRDAYDSETPGFVFDDVYHLAFDRVRRWRTQQMLADPPETATRLYRGQRIVTWDVGAAIYRDLPAIEVAELRVRARRACGLAGAIAAQAGIEFAHALAIAQHYSDADTLATPTWLVDFTTDPWVALFFASDGGMSGTHGVVWNLFSGEYERHADGVGNPLGGLERVVPSGIERISRQAGVFVVAAEPSVFEQHVPLGLETRFAQHEGLVFEDPTLRVSRDYLYVHDTADALRKQLLEWRGRPVTCDCRDMTDCAIPWQVYMEPADPATYRAVLNVWWSGVHPDSAQPAIVRELIDRLARYHALLQTPEFALRLSPADRSINKLEIAFGEMDRTRPEESVDLTRLVLRGYLDQVLDDARPVLIEALHRVNASSG